MDFIGVAEETGLIIPMNRNLLREACEHLRYWQAEFPSDPPLTMSVNVTSKEFAQPDLAGEIGRSLEQTGIDPACLQVEIIETIAMGDAEKSGYVLAQLKSLGVRLSIDDFGTGYSSLSRLRRMPVDTLKIDRAFISNMDSDPENCAIVRAIIILAHNLGLKVVAEGTEREEQINLLKQYNCEMVQGYLFSRPADDLTMLRLLASNRSASAAAGGR
jgi:EAL domain-containing protein (putative c-di-GMP-specific phosphodiesterase class I)